MAYEIHLVPAAAKQFKKIKTKTDQKLIAASLRELAEEPFPIGFSSVEGLPDFWRIKAKDYRIVYTVNEDDQMIVVGRIGHRREVYRRLADMTAAIKVFTSRR